MNCKKYRAYLVGVVVFALVLGIFLYANHGKHEEAPADGVLVWEMTAEEADA